MRSHVTNAYSFQVQRAFLVLDYAFDLFLYTINRDFELSDDKGFFLNDSFNKNTLAIKSFDIQLLIGIAKDEKYN